MYIMCVILVQHFEPQGRRFTNFHYYCYYDYYYLFWLIELLFKAVLRKQVHQ